jgi:hypothetical protein
MQYMYVELSDKYVALANSASMAGWRRWRRRRELLETARVYAMLALASKQH